ncbi:MAG: DEAD/DEAH box helicase [Bacteroidales bacterium]|jgi:superfamily II DNA or RNA helicase|nr:DEAD/DEAH box helicase [Bacteroidales bacterium]
MTTQTEQYLRIYRNDLTEDEKWILQIFSYCFLSLPSRDVAKILGLRMPVTDVIRIHGELRNMGLIETNAITTGIRKDIALTVLTDALKNELFLKIIPDIHKFENLYYRTVAPYRYLRNLFAEHGENRIHPDTVENVRMRMSDYFDYLQPVVANTELAWLFHTIGEKYLYGMFNNVLLDIHADLRPMENLIRFDQKLREIPELVVDGNSSHMILACCSMLDGRFPQMDAQVGMLPERYRNTVLPAGIHALYQDNATLAYRIMNITMVSKKKTEMFVNYEIFYIVYYIRSLLGMDAEQYAPEARKMLSQRGSNFNYSTIIASAMMFHALGDQKNMEEAMSRAEYFSTSVSSLDLIFLYIAASVTETGLGAKYMQTGQALLKKATANGYKLLALELAFALANLYRIKEFENDYRTLSDELGLVSMLSSKQRVKGWELSLNNLLGVMSLVAPEEKLKTDKTARIVYFIDPIKRIVHPCLQTATATGSWTKGRSILLKRLRDNDVEGMSEQDCRIAGTLQYSNHYSNGEGICFSDDVWPALAGHPYLFMTGNPDIPVELIKAQPTVTIEDTDDGLLLKADIDPGDEQFVIYRETNTRYKLIDIDSRQRAVLQAINRGAMAIPPEGKAKLIQVLNALSCFFTIHSDLAEARLGTRTVEADLRIRVQLLPLGDTLKAELFVKPFGSVPPYCKPGVGGQNIIGMVNSERCHVSRDLKTEMRYAEAILQEIQQSAKIDTSQEPIVFDDPRDSLFLLDILSRHQDIAIVEWPEGARFKINRSVSMTGINLEARGVDYWFELSGNLQVDENTVLSLKQLLDLNARSHGRFIELGEGEFLALSNDLKKRLDELQTYADTSDGSVKMSRFASIPLMEMFGQSGSFKGDNKWTEFQEKLAEIKDTQPVIPNTLKAELRPYQEEGFRWMARLAEWDAGACLADDMGLGKTVQALAVLLYRANKGAALVVCPASVVPNWVSETSRFAPSLNVLLLTSANRRKTIEKADAFDLVITTYGLLQSEEKLLAKEKWATVVLDEAHVIKNNNTKTSKAAMNLNALFKLAMTGTPVQNHLGEVWNLFHFINPGLLGSMQQFNDRFVKNAEQGNKRLKKLVAPFILRRTKNHVLEELPPKTEIIMQVELTGEERSFYEAIRRQAIENVQQATSPGGQRHVKALAEIMRLRLACCNPALVEANVTIPSSKLATFMEIVDELRGNNHRALVFSQFVKHLNIIRQALDGKKIRYQYLDGATSMAERERNVRDFQAGEGELFLISLKAGGLGLNLTAADYVIHLDPWWNPAIEDQASDRAHRIGQKRPVTIYHLVSQHTIEEKIIQLHHTKHDIADSLLQGADAPGKLSTEELLKLMMEE